MTASLYSSFDVVLEGIVEQQVIDSLQEPPTTLCPGIGLQSLCHEELTSGDARRYYLYFLYG